MPADLTPRYQGLDLRARRGGGAPAEEEEEAASTEGGRYGNEGGPEGAPAVSDAFAFSRCLILVDPSFFFVIHITFSGSVFIDSLYCTLFSFFSFVPFFFWKVTEAFLSSNRCPLLQRVDGKVS